MIDKDLSNKEYHKHPAYSSTDIKAVATSTLYHWKNSVRKLIEDYSRVEVWTNQPKTSQIWLVESNPYN